MRCVIVGGPDVFELVKSLTVFIHDSVLPDAQACRYPVQFVVRGKNGDNHECVESVVITGLENDPLDCGKGSEWLIKGYFYTSEIRFSGAFSAKSGTGYLEVATS